MTAKEEDTRAVLEQAMSMIALQAQELDAQRRLLANALELPSLATRSSITEVCSPAISETFTLSGLSTKARAINSIKSFNMVTSPFPAPRGIYCLGSLSDVPRTVFPQQAGYGVCRLGTLLHPVLKPIGVDIYLCWLR